MKIARPEGDRAPAQYASCAECGEPYEQTDHKSTGRCDECRQVDRRERERDALRERRRGPRQKGYNGQWDKLSLRARRLQPWCSDCGSPENLTADHTVEAWARQAQGKSIRLQDIDVVCMECNNERGPARGDQASDQHRTAREEFARELAAQQNM